MRFKEAYLRYIAVFLLLFVVYYLNSIFPTTILDKKNNCKPLAADKEIEQMSLYSEQPILSFDSIFQSDENYFYRLLIKYKSNKQVKANIYLSGPLEQEIKVKEIIFEPADEFGYNEQIIQTPGRYTNVIIKLVDENEQGKVIIPEIKANKLQITQIQQIKDLRPLIVGNTVENEHEVGYLDSDLDKYTHLSQKETTLGQVFLADFDYITSVMFDIGMVGSGGEGKYQLTLQEATKQGNRFIINKEAIYKMKFTPCSLQKFQTIENYVQFPLIAKVEKGKYYFIGINNNSVFVNDSNYLVLKGNENYSSDDKGIITKNKNQTINPSGTLFFSVKGSDYKLEKSARILIGQKIEDIGQGSGVLTFKTSDSATDFINLNQYTQDVNYSPKNKAISGQVNKNSFFEYNIESLYPLSTVHITANKPRSDWNNFILMYSFDHVSWHKVPFMGGENNQLVDYYFNNEEKNSNIYIRVMPDLSSKEKYKRYGIKNLIIRGKLSINNLIN